MLSQAELQRQLQGYVSLEFLGEKVSTIVCDDGTETPLLIVHVAVNEYGKEPFALIPPISDEGWQVGESLGALVERLQILMLYAYEKEQPEVILMCQMEEV